MFINRIPVFHPYSLYTECPKMTLSNCRNSLGRTKHITKEYHITYSNIFHSFSSVCHFTLKKVITLEIDRILRSDLLYAYFL